VAPEPGAIRPRAYGDSMIVQLTRFVFFTSGVLGGYAVSRMLDWSEQLEGLPQEFVIILFIILGASIGFILGGMVGRELTRLYEHIESRIEEVGISDLVLGSVGLLLGLVVGLLVSYPLRLLQPRSVAFLSSVLLFGLSGYGGLRAFLTKRHEFARLFSRLTPAEDGAALEPAVRPKLLDTSAVIDARFTELLREGFLEPPLRLPRFVLAELQTLADSADDLKRARGRRGLDLLQSITGPQGQVEVFETDYADLRDVDEKLLRLGADTGGTVITVDYNLTKVARVAGVGVLNLNELSVALRPRILPGERLRVLVSREGREAGQGVAYLEDGTMVVIAGGRGAIGKEVDAEVTSVLQTSAGRMIFTKLQEAV